MNLRVREKSIPQTSNFWREAKSYKRDAPNLKKKKNQYIIKNNDFYPLACAKCCQILFQENEHDIN